MSSAEGRKVTATVFTCQIQKHVRSKPAIPDGAKCRLSSEPTCSRGIAQPAPGFRNPLVWLDRIALPGSESDRECVISLDLDGNLRNRRLLHIPYVWIIAGFRSESQGREGGRLLIPDSTYTTCTPTLVKAKCADFIPENPATGVPEWEALSRDVR